jgi:putative spermidine/putrescine transport system permease protein
MSARLGSNVVGSAVLAFLVLPIFAVVPASFNRTSFIRLPPETWSWRWYVAFLNDPEWSSSLLVSLKVGVLSTALAVVLGTVAALAIERVGSRTRAVLLAMVLSPLVVPVIMTSIALYYVLRPIGLHGTLLGLALGHTLLALPFVVVNVSLSLRGINPNSLRAAEGLGASALHAFRTITLPLILPGLAGGATFAFITSFDEVVISIFLSGVQAKTLPVKIWETIRVEFTPVTAVAATILLVVTMVLFLIVRVGAAGGSARELSDGE